MGGSVDRTAEFRRCAVDYASRADLNQVALGCRSIPCTSIPPGMTKTVCTSGTYISFKLIFLTVVLVCHAERLISTPSPKVRDFEESSGSLDRKHLLMNAPQYWFNTSLLRMRFP